MVHIRMRSDDHCEAAWTLAQPLNGRQNGLFGRTRHSAVDQQQPFSREQILEEIAPAEQRLNPNYAGIEFYVFAQMLVSPVSTYYRWPTKRRMAPKTAIEAPQAKFTLKPAGTAPCAAG